MRVGTPNASVSRYREAHGRFLTPGLGVQVGLAVWEPASQFQKHPQSSQGSCWVMGPTLMLDPATKRCHCKGFS